MSVGDTHELNAIVLSRSGSKDEVVLTHRGCDESLSSVGGFGFTTIFAGLEPLVMVPPKLVFQFCHEESRRSKIDVNLNCGVKNAKLSIALLKD